MGDLQPAPWIVKTVAILHKSEIETKVRFVITGSLNQEKALVVTFSVRDCENIAD